MNNVPLKSDMKLIGLMIVLFALITGCVHEPAEGRLTPEQTAARAQQSARIHTELAAEYYYRGQHKIALEEIDAALKANANYAPAYSMLGLVHMALEENEKAAANFDRALRIEPGNAEIHNNYGWFLCQRFSGQMDKAINHFMIALKDPLYDTRHIAYANAGICELKRNNFTQASTYLNESLSQNPTYSPALVGMIEMDFKKGNIAVARSKLKEFMQSKQPTARSLWLGIQIEQASGNSRAADSYLFQLQKNYPDSRELKAVREGGF